MMPSDWLLAPGDERVGCLAFSETPAPPSPRPGYAATADLDSLADGFERLERGEAVERLAARLWTAGMSMGGARPKAVIESEGALWIAKFQRRDDTYDQCGALYVSDRHELFRRMVFNVLCGNRDDHLKNHSFLRSGDGWRLSQAFDVVPQPDMDSRQAIGVG